MQETTLAIGIIGVVLVLSLRPTHALAAYFAVLFFYPTYVVVSVGTIDISASRIVIAVLLLRFLANDNLRTRFKWCRLDSWVVFYITIGIAVMCITRPLLETLENRGGFFMDTWFAYLAVRLCITDRAALISFVKCVGIVLIPIVFLSVLECTVGWRPYATLRQYCPWRTRTTIKAGRFGFERAEGPFGQAIMLGTSFALLVPWFWSLRHERGNWRGLAYLLTAVAIVGGMSSMSGGPWNTLILIIFFLALETRKHWIMPLLALFAFSCIFIEIASNRPFYHVIVSYINPLGGTAWHRARIIDIAIETFGEWWFLGYGGEDSGWGERLGTVLPDVTNEFAIAGIMFGVLGIIGLCAVLACALRMLVRLHNQLDDPALKSWCWALSATLVAVIITFMSTGFYGQTRVLFYCILGMTGSMPFLCSGHLSSQKTGINKS